MPYAADFEPRVKQVSQAIRKVILAMGCGVVLAGQAALAEEMDEHHGAAGAGRLMGVEAGVTYTYQHSMDDAVNDESFASVDVVVTHPVGDGELLLYLEGNTTPSSHGVAALIGEANADVGSALDEHGKGRLQVSELHYTLPMLNGNVTLGLMDVSGFLDTSELANDEATQFLAGGLTGNATIEFPDYTLGVVYHSELDDVTSLTAVLAGSHGLADNPEHDYASLFEMNKAGKGMFAGVEGRHAMANGSLQLGAWVNTADHDNLKATSTDDNNYGVYAVVENSWGDVSTNLRAGFANSAVSEAASYFSAAMELATELGPVGLGIARTNLADDAAAAGRDDVTEVEAFWRVEVTENIAVTPSLQWIQNSGFDSSGTTIEAEQTILGLRINARF